MAANPISCLEIEAFCRLQRLRLGGWEADLLMRLDDAVLATWRANSAEAGTGDPRPAQEAGQVSMSDGAGVNALLRRLKARKAAEFAGQTTPQPPPEEGRHG